MSPPLPEVLDWTRSLSQSTARLKRSAVREILKAAVRPDVISFAGGLPAPEAFPTELIARATASLLDGGEAARSLQYGESEGLKELRARLADEVGVPFEQVLITAGAQQGLDLLGRVLLDPGDVVLVENPTYLGALGAWRPHGVTFEPVDVDGEGLCVDALEAVLDRTEPKFLYTMPTFHNPGGFVMTLERRVRLIEVAARRGVLLIEDDPYGQLRYEGEPLPSLLALAQELGLEHHVVRLGSFSKVMAPGLRVGWLTAPPALVDAMVKVKQAADFHPSILGQRIVVRLLQDRAYPEHLQQLCHTYGERKAAMVSAVEQSFPEGATWTNPQGGMFLMVRLPEGWDATRCFEAALDAKVAYVTVDHFSVDGTGKDAIRLNFTNAAPERIREGVERLGQLFRSTFESP